MPCSAAGSVTAYVSTRTAGTRSSARPRRWPRRPGTVVAQGYTALKFDPFGHTSRTVGPVEESLAIELIQAVRDAIGPRVDLLDRGP